MRHPHRLSAFSLVELLVVVAVIAVLAGIMLPAIAAVKQAAQRTQCASNIRQLILGTLAFAGDNQGMVPTAGVNWGYSNWVTNRAQGRWMQSLDPYVGTYTVFNCPVSAKLQPNFVMVDKLTNGWIQRGDASSGTVCLYAYNVVDWGRYPDYSPGPKGPMTIARTQAYIQTFNPAYTATNCPVFTDGVAYSDASQSGAYAYFVNNAWGCYFPHAKRQSTAYIDGRVTSNAFTDYTVTGTASSNGVIQADTK